MFAVSQNGIYGVYLFFVVSGFLITRMLESISPSLYRPSFRNFYVRRVGRILPLLGLTVFFGVLMVSFGAASTLAFQYCFKSPFAVFDPTFWLSILTFSFNWYRIVHSQTAPFLGLHWDVLWSLSIEEQFYLFYPLALAWVKTENRFIGFLIGILVLASSSSLAAYGLQPHSYLILMNSFTAFGSIALGALLHILSKRKGAFLRERKGLCGLFCGIGFSTVTLVYFTTSTRNPVDCIYGPITLSAGLFIFLLGGQHLELFESGWFKALALPGKVSYGAYLLHPAVLYFVSPVLVGMDATVHYGLFIFVTIGTAWISYRFFETPINQWLRGKLEAV